MAKAEGKPMLLDFTGWACVNCRKMEEQVWTNPKVAKILNEDVVLVSLYVDDRTLYQKMNGELKNTEARSLTSRPLAKSGLICKLRSTIETLSLLRNG